MKKIRKNVFETNSSSSHTISISKKEPFMNWELESFRGKTLVYRNDNLFDCSLLHNDACTTTGTKFTLLLGLLNAFIDDDDVKDMLGLNENESVFNLDMYSWISTFLKEQFDIEFIWNNWNGNEEIDGTWLDESKGETLYKLYNYVYNINDTTNEPRPYNYMELKIIEVLKNENDFIDFLEKFILDENVVLIDSYGEW